MDISFEPRYAHAARAAGGLIARIADVALISFGALAAALVLPGPDGDPLSELAAVACAATFALMLFPAFRLYHAPAHTPTHRTALLTAFAWLAAQAGAALVMRVLAPTLAIPLPWYLLWTATSGIALVASRVVAGTTLERISSPQESDLLVAIVGTGAHRDAVLDRIAGAPSAGFRAAAMCDIASADTTRPDGMPCFADLDTFARHVRAHAIPEVWLALPIGEARVVMAVLDVFRDDLVNIRFMPDVSKLAMFDGEMIDLVGAPAINLVASSLSSRALLHKAIFDRVFAATVLVVLAPLLLAIAAAVRLSSNGPVLFRQQRKGADGQAFTIFKFRTMRLHDAGSEVCQAARDDPRITRVGAFLRRTSLDELPQFLNVLRGEMSVVGPRPHALEHDDLYRKIVDGYIHRYRVKPGITGWAQINGLRGETDRVEKMQRRVEADLHYLRNWSFALDMRIVLATALRGWSHRNAY
ncbi:MULTISPECIES: undecaprenyl-phosphate glucose phosphotransferase [unclassified Burkholderia]|uniref:undecaprenyl-phosphate glucose phosphotransferase n=1 Tax=unclassified Burkholderia TaxID=2613784 RepID=UPI001E3C3FCC|nr:MULTISPECIES: undecaprenyl-phosphate glucose phosphotransferase [unclassified Burkholderia]UEP30182.1 undecaprenyl-phosphate glucose phosphotransferase [Burkholderia sp. B21-007]UEP44504.1 undecaprenyl-phosphate glucose phosphotransferase [Burkholderia sp. B21-005]